MSELLHVGALLPAVVGTGALVRRDARPPAPEVVASILMLVAMADAMLWHVITPVYWSAALIVAALALVVRRRRGALSRDRSNAGGGAADVALTVHAALGLVVTSGLLMASAVDTSAAASAGGHCHSCASGGVDAIQAMALVLCAGYVLVTAWCARSTQSGPDGHARSWHYWMMAVSAVAMGAMIVL